MAKRKLPISLLLYNPVTQGYGQMGDFTLPFLPTWRRSIARLGGYKIGTVSLTTEHMTPDAMSDFFRNGLMREIREMGNNMITWQGAVTRMAWTHRGDVFTIDVNNVCTPTVNNGLGCHATGAPDWDVAFASNACINCHTNKTTAAVNPNSVRASNRDR